MNATHRQDRIGRALLWSMWGFGLFLFVMIIAFADPFLDALCIGILVLGIDSACVCLVMVMIPAVTLSEEGIVVRAVFRERFHSWQEIKQAGILYGFGRGCFYNVMVLVPPHGSPRRYKDRSFYLRNLGKAICFRLTDETKAYVIGHYGPLDFDLSDGRGEQSIVAE